MGLKALANGVIRFRDVHLPADQRIGDEGAGLRIALTTLNTGRLSIPAALAGGAKRCLQLASRWAEAREQWGAPIGEHEAVTHMLSDIASTTFALEAVADLVGDFADREGYDIRLEAAAAKELNTTRFWHLVDQTLQVRGGRGYETARSLADRGEAPAEVERMMRDARINTIFEGSSEIMHLFMAREAVDRHLEVAGTLVDPKASRSDRLGALPGIAAHYAWWYPSRYFGWAQWPSYTDYGSLATHLRFANRSARRLARSIFHGMVAYRAGLERKQAFLFRAVDVALELFALVATVTRAKAIHDARRPDAEHAVALADAYALGARRRVDDLLRDLFDNDDEARYRTGRAVLDGEHRWLEAGIVGLPYSVEDLRPASVAQIRQAEAGGSAGGGRSGGDRRPRAGQRTTGPRRRRASPGPDCGPVVRNAGGPGGAPGAKGPGSRALAAGTGLARRPGEPVSRRPPLTPGPPCPASPVTPHPRRPPRPRPPPAAPADPAARIPTGTSERCPRARPRSRRPPPTGSRRPRPPR